MVVDEEKHLPFEASSKDMIISAMFTHWWNDLPGILTNILNILKPDGVFVGAMLGGESLHELRSSFVLAEQDREGGVSPHTSPFAGIREAGNVLTRAGFNLPTSLFWTTFFQSFSQENQ